MKVIGNVKISEWEVDNLAARLRFPDEGSLYNHSAYGERFSVGDSEYTEILIGEDFRAVLHVSAVRFKDGHKGLLVETYAGYRADRCYCGEKMQPGQFYCPVCGAS